jgi:hypothetical protein
VARPPAQQHPTPGFREEMLKFNLNRKKTANDSRKRQCFFWPYIMNTFKCLDHSVDVTSALHTTVNPSIGHLSKYLKQQQIGYYYGQLLHKLSQVASGKETDLLHWLVVVCWVHKFSATKLLS